MDSTPILRAVIFDLDGVLTHTSKYHAQAWADLVRGLGVTPPPDLEERVRGVSRLESLRIALGRDAARFTPRELEDLAERKNAAYLKAVKGITPGDLAPGALDLLHQLKATGIMVVLGSASRNSRAVLQGLGILGEFDAIADGHSFTRSKPDPDVFLTAARLAGVRPGDCVVVEDAEAGIAAALAGGFTAVGIGRRASLRRAHLCVESLAELSPAALRKLHRRVQAGR